MLRKWRRITRDEVKGLVTVVMAAAATAAVAVAPTPEEEVVGTYRD